MVRYTRHDLHGLLVIDKPLGMGSTQVVRRVRRLAGNCKTGHAGTLDPLATGVLVCCLGKGTRAVERLMGLTKVYEAAVDLSAFTATDDAEAAPEPVVIERPPTREEVRAALDRLTGEILQTPPRYSAICVGGKRSYDLARKGHDVPLEPRRVRIDAIRLDAYAFPTLKITVTCGKGTYIRSLARQIGELLHTGGYLTALRRTAIGPYTLAVAKELEQLPQPLLPEHLLPIPGEGDRE